MKKRSKKTWLCAPLYLWCILFVGLPLVYVAGVSFCTRDATWGITAVFTLENYRMIVDPMYLRVFTESLLLSAVCTVIALLIGYPFAYAMVKATPARQALLMMLVIVPFWTSALIRANGWMLILRANGPINSALKALGVIQRPLKLLYTRGAVMLGYVYTMLPFTILPCYTALARMDFSLVAAARDLGARPLRVFFTITLPLTMGGVMSAVTLTLIPSLGIFFLSDLLGGGKTVLIGNLIQNQLLTARNTPFGAALSVVLLLLTALVMWVQRKMGGETRIL
ncbi:MAG TPA: ABC transporter permease [Candidatus Aphodomonas merdavium]|nr:ABC transporter permease [Candidatus Aphodomonas merdavium]